MAKYDRLALRAKLELRLQEVYDDAAERTAMNEAAFGEYVEAQIRRSRGEIAKHEKEIEEWGKLEFGGERPERLRYSAIPGPVQPDAGKLRDLQRALDELDILVGDEITLKSTAMLKLL